MIKIALFVEGQTESIFISELIKQIFGENRVKIIIHKIQYSNDLIRTETLITDRNEEYYFLIHNCGTDNKVKSNILENQHGLKQAGFKCIIGLQDLYNPQRRKQGINNKRFQESINKDIPQAIPSKINLAIQEIEAWFIAEETHFQKISSYLTLEIINSIIGFNIQLEDTEIIPHPSVVLDKIYKAGKRKNGYSKNQYAISDVIAKLDYDNLYLTVRKRNNSLNELLTCLDGLIP